MAILLIITLTVIIVLFLVLFDGFVFFMYKDWNNNIKSAEDTKLEKNFNFVENSWYL